LDDGTLACVVDHRILHVQRVRRDDARDEVLLRAPCRAKPKRQQYTVPPSLMNVCRLSLMFCSPGKAESPVVGKPLVETQ